VLRLQIDGSYGEGGGQIIRTACSLAAITGQAFEIDNIRAGRDKPGLKPQHLAAVQAAARIRGARLEGAEPGSTALQFEPQGEVQPGHYEFLIGTAGSTTLVGQTVLPPLLLTGASEVKIVGGTYNDHAPTSDFLGRVYLPALAKAGAEATARSEVAGFYPKGGGELELTIPGPQALQPFYLVERGELQQLRAIVVTSGLPSSVGERARHVLERRLSGYPLHVELVEKPSLGPGAAVSLIAECEHATAGFTGLGRRGKPMEAVAEEPCEEFLRWEPTGAACDEHLADQLVLPAALSGGTCRWSTHIASEHLHTVLWLVRQFVPLDYTIEQDGQRSVVSTTAPKG
jgi:RNA 3'-terminal phosphate cyclase (ATP)